MRRNPRRTASGFRIPVPYNPLTGKYAPLGPEKDHQAIVLFEATSALVYADPLDATAPTLTARKWAYDKTTGERAVDEAETETTVYMSVADFDSEAYLGVAHIAEGDHFWAVLDSQAGRWEVVIITVGFDRCTALAKGDITGTGTKTVDNVIATRGTSPLDDPTDTAEELSVNNPHAYDVDDNGLVRLEWNEATETWDIYQATCPA